MKRIVIFKFILIFLCSVLVFVAKNQTMVGERTISGEMEKTKAPDIDKWFY
ncbi:MAG: hypothetical protein JNM93_02715 [Bacteriovoracaceae bacterium]|nr:hypothetical protein [Bacteriovoracaceae bacterium]